MIVFMIQFVLVLLVLSFGVFVLLEFRATRRAGAGSGASSAETCTEALAPASLPAVTVLLPLCDEEEMAAPLLDAVCGLRYPAERLEIIALDDSSDGTSAILAEKVSEYAKRGVAVRLARRGGLEGYKAGNLQFGLSLAQGEFIAIFDADCRPPADFLLRVMPSFQDGRVGFLQTGVSYRNRDASFLTAFQAVEAGHKEKVTQGQALEGGMASLTGSSCVWRRACIEAIGGVSADTITEDVDMGYAAQLHHWRYEFLGSVVSTAELPEGMGAFRVQRHRWACGLMRNAGRHLCAMFAAKKGLMPRVQALALMFSALLLAMFYALLLLALPLAWLLPASGGPFFHVCCSCFLGLALFWAWNNVSGALGCTCSPLRRCSFALGYVVMFFPLALYYFCAAIESALGVQNAFHRTPKGRRAARQGYPAVNARLLGLELLSLGYAGTTLALSLSRQAYWVALFAFLAGAGFVLTLFFSWRESREQA